MYLRRLTAAKAPATKAMVKAARASRGGVLLLPIGLLSGVVGCGYWLGYWVACGGDVEVIGLRENASSLVWGGKRG